VTTRTWVAAAIVLVPLVGYPLIAVAGGLPRFPNRAECEHGAVEGQPVDVVFGRYDDPRSAADAGDHVVAVGFKGTEAVPDGCGRWKVVLARVPSVEIGREIQKEAGTVDLDSTLELASSN
jgi:hypothetical protein